MEFLKAIQDTLSSQIEDTFNFVNLTYVETNTDRLFFSSLQQDIVQINSTVHHLWKEVKVPILDRNFFIILFQLRSHLVTLHNGLNPLRINVSFFNNKSSLRDQFTGTNHIPIKPHDLTSLPTKLEVKLISYPQLPLPVWYSENIWYMYKFMKLQLFIVSNTLYTVLHMPLVHKSLQFHLFRIHNIPIVHVMLKKSFQFNIQEEYLAIRLDKQYISFPLSVDIMVCWVSNGQFCCINTLLYTADTPKACSYALFLQNTKKINTFYTLSIINKTQDKAFNINENFWAISTLESKKKLYITCL